MHSQTFKYTKGELCGTADLEGFDEDVLVWSDGVYALPEEGNSNVLMWGTGGEVNAQRRMMYPVMQGSAIGS